LPAGFTQLTRGHATVVARPSDVPLLSQLLSEESTLYDAALRLPRIHELRGRGVTPVVEVGGVRCVVRHYRRGGSVASALGDRYLRTAGNRLLRELRASEAVRARGVATPEVRFGAWYDGGIFRRYDLATLFIPSARDLSSALFDEDERARVVTLTTRLVRDVVRSGLLHRDLNLKNIVVDAERAYVLDLDCAHVFDRLTQVQAAAMQTRFLRSLAKWEDKLGRSIPQSVKHDLSEAFRV
jgi:tRNA A-37 threonylcarbamoyl transferase component Bud32